MPLAPLFACSLISLTRSLAPDCSLRSRPPLRSLVRSLAHFAHSLAHFAHSLARGTVIYKMAILSVFFPILDHSQPQKTTPHEACAREREARTCNGNANICTLNSSVYTVQSALKSHAYEGQIKS